MKDTPRKIEISHRTIIFTIFFLIFLYLVFLVKDILFLLFVSFLITTAINPLVDALDKKKVPRGLSIGIVYVILVALLVGLIAGIVPPLVHQSLKLINQIPIPPEIADSFSNIQFTLQDIDVIISQLDSIPKIFEVVGSALTIVAVLTTVMVISFYMLKKRTDLHKDLLWIFGNSKTEKEAEAFVNRVEEQIGGWVRGQLTLMFVVGLMTYVGLILLNINFALPLAIIAGIFEVLPNIGPTISAIPAILIAFLTSSPTIGIAVTALYILVQQLENNFIVPIIMRKAANMNPITTIVTVLIGFRLMGVGGAALSIPLFLVLRVCLQEYLKIKNSRK